MVILHDWSGNFKKFYGSKKIRTYKDFMSHKMNHKLKRLTLDDLLDLFKRNKNFSIITNIKSNNVKGLKHLSEIFSNYKSRIIPQIYNLDEFKNVKNLGFSQIILTLYKMKINKKNLVNFLNKERLYAVTIPK